MAGQGTVAVEMLNDISVPIDILLVAVGGGGLLAGVGSYFKHVSPHTKIIAVESEGAPALYKALEAGKPVKLDTIDTFADGIAVKSIGDKTFDIVKEVIDKIILVSEGKICSTILSLYNDEAIVVEPAGAVSVAALDFIKEDIKGKNVAIIICGGNNDISRTEEIRERALIYEGKKHYFIIRFPQRAGAFKDFLNVLGPEDDITYFEYIKKNNRETGPALVGIELKNKEDFEALKERMHAAHINYEHINKSRTLFELLV
jgi:threonine dehydratase